jgi:hypothetical protein
MRGAGLRGVRWSNQLPSHRLDDVSNTPDAPFDFTPENYGIVATILCVRLMGRRAAACGGCDRVIVLVLFFGAHACVASTAFSASPLLPRAGPSTRPTTSSLRLFRCWTSRSGRRATYCRWQP